MVRDAKNLAKYDAKKYVCPEVRHFYEVFSFLKSFIECEDWIAETILQFAIEMSLEIEGFHGLKTLECPFYLPGLELKIQLFNNHSLGDIFLLVGKKKLKKASLQLCHQFTREDAYYWYSMLDNTCRTIYLNLLKILPKHQRCIKDLQSMEIIFESLQENTALLELEVSGLSALSTESWQRSFFQYFDSGPSVRILTLSGCVYNFQFAAAEKIVTFWKKFYKVLRNAVNIKMLNLAGSSSSLQTSTLDDFEEFVKARPDIRKITLYTHPHHESNDVWLRIVKLQSEGYPLIL